MRHLMHIALVLVGILPTSWSRAEGSTGPLESYVALREMIGRCEFDGAIEKCKSLIVQHPSYGSFYETLPEVCQYADRLQDAVSFFEHRVEDGTELGLAYFGLGFCRYLQEEYQAAVTNFSRSIENDIKAPMVYRYFQYAYEKVEGVDGSIRLLTNLCHRFPANAGFWYANGLAYWSKNDFKQVLRNLEEAIARAPTERSYLQARVAVEYYLGLPSCSKLKLFELARSARDNGDFSAALLLRSYLLGLDLGASNFAEVTQGCRDLIAEANKFGFVRWAGWGWSRLADAMRWQGNYKEALPYVMEAKACARTCRDFELLSYCMTCEFDIHIETGHLSKAIASAVKRALICADRQHTPGYVAALNDIAWGYHEVGENRLALDFANGALAIAETVPLDDRNLCQAHTCVGLAYQGLGLGKEALRHFVAADEINPNDKFHDRVKAITKGNLGCAHLLLGDVRSAEKDFKEQLRLATSQNFARELAYALANVGQQAFEAGDHKKSTDFFMHSYEISRRNGYRSAMLHSLRWLAKLHEASGDLTSSLYFYSMMGLVADSMFDGYDMLDMRRRLLKNLNYYQDYIDLLCRLGRVETAMSISEEAKGSVTWDFSEFMNQLRNARDNVEELTGSLKSICSRLEFQFNKPFVPGLSQLISQYETSPPDEIRRLLKLHEDFFDRVDSLTSLTDWKSSMSSRVHPTLVAIQRCLVPHSDALCEFFVGENTTHLFVMTSDSIRHCRIVAGGAKLREALVGISPVLVSPHGADGIWNPSLANFNLRSSKAMYTLLFGEVHDFIKGYRRLTIVPEGPLANLPFEALVSPVHDAQQGGGPAGVEFLIERSEVRYLPRASSVFGARGERHATRFLLAVCGSSGPPIAASNDDFPVKIANRYKFGVSRDLAGAEMELDAIAGHFTGRTDIVREEEATRDRILSIAPKYRVIHFAAHADQGLRNGEEEAVWLHGNPGSGVPAGLSGSDFAALDLTADMVVLSSCRANVRNEEYIDRGLVGGLLMAQVPSVVAALWAVDDKSTAALMEAFYRRLKTGEGKAHALQQAKIELIRLGMDNPFYWAAFVLIGDSGPLEVASTDTQPHSFGHRWVGAVISICALFLVILILRKSAVQLHT